MTLWFLFTAMISVAAVLVSAPFIRRLERSRLQSAGGAAVNRDQSKEIENDVAQGLIASTQAESAEIGIKPRIPAADRMDDPSSTPLAWQQPKFAVTALAIIVVFGSILLYAIAGSPDLPSAAMPQARLDQPSIQPFSAATSASRPATTRSVAQLQGNGSQPAAQLNVRPQTGLPSVEEMIKRVQTRLQVNPQDTEGWRLLGWSYFNIQRFADAADAYSRAIELRPASAEYRSARGEALLRGANGVVTADARKDFEEALQLDPKDARARFFIGLAKEQAGDKLAALSDWNNLLADVSPAEPWFPELKQRAAELRRDPGDATVAPPAAAPDLSVDALREFLQAEKSRMQVVNPDPPRGPSAQDIRNAESMAPQDRTAMIRGMVDGLSSRLEQSPRDAEGWIKLIRSRIVLGDPEQARRSLQRALTFFTDDGSERTRIVEAARQLGLDP